MGQVYLGRDRLGELVAVKVVHPGFAHDERFRLRFRREVEISRAVTGPWVAAVVDADPDAGTPWLATQYVRGPSLGAAVQACGPLPTGTVHVLAHGLAVALSAVHDAGLVHRDLKPSNVLLGTDHPRLIDFGISRAIDATQVTSTGVVVGTPAFMSPEQIAGAEVGPASDVFSLGSVLAFATTGRSPFGDHAPLVLMMRISGQEPDLDAVPDVLRGPIAACLAKRPEDRPTAAELSGMLGTVVADGPGWLPAEVAALGTGPHVPTAPPAPTKVATGSPAPAWPRRFSRRTWLLGTLGLAGAGGLGLAAAYALPRPPEPRWTVPGPRSMITAAAADDTTLYTYSDDGDRAVLAVDSASGAERWAGPGWTRTSSTGTAERLVPAGPVLVVGTGEVLAALDTATGRRLWEVPRSVEALVNPGMAVAGGTVVATTREGLVALDVRTGGRLWAADVGNSPELGDVAIQGGTCISTTGSEVDGWELRTGRHLWRIYTTDFQPEQTVNAGALFLVEDGTSVLGVDTATGEVRWSVPMGFGASITRWESCDIRADMIIAYGVTDAMAGVAVALDPAGGAVRWAKSEPGWEFSNRIITTLAGADGIVYVAPINGSVRAYDVATGDQRWAYDTTSLGVVELIARGHDVFVVSPSSQQIQAFTIA
jgi:outer membrane protein assembly factor BamB